MARGSTNEEAIAILNVYESNKRSVKSVKQKLIKVKGKIHISTMMLKISILYLNN